MRLLIISLLALLTAGLCAESVAAQTETITGTIDGTTNVRSGPDPRFEIVGQLQDGDQVIVDGRESAAARWLHITLEDAGGWIPAFMLLPDGDVTILPILDTTVEEALETAVRVIAYGRVNVRSAPGIDGEIIGQLDVNDEAEVIARSSSRNDWLMIHLDDETEGWVAYFTVTVTGDPSGLPILVPDSTGAGLIPPSVLVRTLFNARLHIDPTLSSPLTIIVPYNAEVTPIARSERGDWVYVGYAGVEGWGVARLFAITNDDLMALPVNP